MTLNFALILPGQGSFSKRAGRGEEGRPIPVRDRPLRRRRQKGHRRRRLDETQAGPLQAEGVQGRVGADPQAVGGGEGPAERQEGHHEARRIHRVRRRRRRGVGLSREVAAPPGPVATEAVVVAEEARHHFRLERRPHLEIGRLDVGQQGEPRQQRLVLHTPACSRADEVSSSIIVVVAFSCPFSTLHGGPNDFTPKVELLSVGAFNRVVMPNLVGPSYWTCDTNKIISLRSNTGRGGGSMESGYREVTK